MESSEVINAGKNEEEEVDIDLNDPDVANAAVKIQAGFRAHIKAKKSDTAKSSVTKESSPVAEQESEEVIDIDLNDPEVEKAALKIQAGFKGFRKAKKATTQV